MLGIISEIAVVTEVISEGKQIVEEVLKLFHAVKDRQPSQVLSELEILAVDSLQALSKLSANDTAKVASYQEKIAQIKSGAVSAHDALNIIGTIYSKIQPTTTATASVTSTPSDSAITMSVHPEMPTEAPINDGGDH